MVSPGDAVADPRCKEMDLLTGYHAKPLAISEPYLQGTCASKDENMSRTVIRQALDRRVEARVFEVGDA